MLSLANPANYFMIFSVTLSWKILFQTIAYLYYVIKMLTNHSL